MYYFDDITVKRIGLSDVILYMRWLLLTMTLPSVQFSISPWQYDDAMVLRANQLQQVRSKWIVPTLEAINSDNGKLGDWETGFPTTVK